MTIGQRIKKVREELNLTQSDVAKRVGVATQTIFKYENEIVTNIPLDKFEKIANALNVTPAYLMGWEDEQESTNETEIFVMNIGHRIKELRELKKLTQEDLGNIIGVNKATINRYETGVIDIKRTTAIKLSKVFEVSPAYIMGWDEKNDDKSTTLYSLNQNEIQLIKTYRNLNELGKNKVIEYVSDISEQSKYTSNNNIADDIMNELKQIADERMQTLTPHTKLK